MDNFACLMMIMMIKIGCDIILYFCCRPLLPLNALVDKKVPNNFHVFGLKALEQ
jgi:hypothetical protein